MPPTAYPTLIRYARRVPFIPRRLEDFCLMLGVEHTVQPIKEMEFLAIIAMKQRNATYDIPPREIVETRQAELRRRLPLGDIRVYLRFAKYRCGCRKPKPGTLIEAAQAHDIELGASYLVSDRRCDVAAGRGAGSVAIFVNHRFFRVIRRWPRGDGEILYRSRRFNRSCSASDAAKSARRCRSCWEARRISLEHQTG